MNNTNDEELEALERQGQHLKKMMMMMEKEWEESGAGIGWLQLVHQHDTDESIKTCIKTPDITPRITALEEPFNLKTQDTSKMADFCEEPRHHS